jgi:hypothetical protein
MANMSKPYCDQPGSGKCVQCLNSKVCPEATPICDDNTKGCTTCQADDKCQARNGATPACDKDTGKCVQCTEDKHCGDAKRPICNKEMQVCVPCASDGQCVARNGAEPGICMNAPSLSDGRGDGHCATAGETIYVDAGANLCLTGSGGDGSLKSPFCGVAGALGKVDKNHILVIVQGTTGIAGWSAGTGPAFALVGRRGATISPGGSPGIHITGRDVFIRTLTINGSNLVGVIAEGDAVLRMDRCLVTGNQRGGILVNKAGYAITNTIVANNKRGDLPDGQFFGGVYLLGSGGKPSDFRYNTLAQNAYGLTCMANITTGSLLVSGSTDGPDYTGCMLGANSLPMNTEARLDATYHLGSNSPCIGQGGPEQSPNWDFDGQPRTGPGDTTTDCGADEYSPP